MINNVNVTMIDGSPKMAHKARACRRILIHTGIHGSVEVPPTPDILAKVGSGGLTFTSLKLQD